MTRRQIRELLILVALVAAGVLVGMGVRTWTGRTRSGGASTGAGSRQGPASDSGSRFIPIPDDKVVARLEGKDITGAMLSKYVDFNLGVAGVQVANLPPSEVNFARRQSLNQMAEDMIVERYAQEHGIEVASQEIEATLAEARQAYESDQAFEKDLSEVLHVSYDELSGFILRLLMKQKVVAAFEPAEPVTEEEVNRKLEAFREQMKSHPGGPVEVTKELVRSHLEERARRKAYEVWLARQMEDEDLEILEPSLKTQPISSEGGSNQQSGMVPSAEGETDPDQPPQEPSEGP